MHTGRTSGRVLVGALLVLALLGTPVASIAAAPAWHTNGPTGPSQPPAAVTALLIDPALGHAFAGTDLGSVYVLHNAELSQPPVASNDTAVAHGNTAIVIDVLTNDSDPEGALNPASITITSAPSHGSARVSAGTITYTPNSSFVDSDSLAYTVADAAGAVSQPATVTIVQPLLALAPARIDFGDVDAGSTSAPVTATLSNPGTSTLTLSSISAAPAPFALDASHTTCRVAQPLAPNAHCTLAYVMAPTATGTFAGTIAIASDAPTSPQHINLTGKSSATKQFTLTYHAGAHGAIHGLKNQTVAYGKNGTPVTAVPDTGYHFTQWSDASTSNPRTDTNVAANISVSAAFAIDTFTVTAAVNGGHGDVTPKTQTVNYGARAQITLVPDKGYRAATIRGCPGRRLSATTWQSAPLTAACNLTVSYTSAPAVSPSIPVPTTTAWSRWLLALLLLGAASLAWRRRTH